MLKQEDSPEHWEQISSLVPPQIKEEQEDLHQRPVDAEGSPLTLLAVKSEDHVGNTWCSIEHMERQSDAENSGLLHPSTGVNVLSSHCSESDTENCDEWQENMEDEPYLSILKSQETQVEEETVPWSQTLASIMSHNGEDPFSCNVCGKGFILNCNLKRHMMIHTRGTPLSCNDGVQGPPSPHHMAQGLPNPPLRELDRQVRLPNRKPDPTHCRARRTRTTGQQRELLEKEFHHNPRITPKRAIELSVTLQLTERQIQVWFQNRRRPGKGRKVTSQGRPRGPRGEQPS